MWRSVDLWTVSLRYSRSGQLIIFETCVALVEGLLIFALVGLRPSTESRLSRFGWSLLTALGVNTFPCSSVDHPANVRRVVNLIRRVAGDCAASAEG